jgi:hypothetical protein
MRNSSFSHVGTPSRKYQPRIRGLKVASLTTSTLANEIVTTKDIVKTKNNAKNSNRMPLQFTGCISELSCASEDYHGYGAALKNYVEAYRISHSYVESGTVMVEHDYTLNVTETEEHGSLGLLGDEIERTVRSHVHFSDEEIEQCGYLGWLQH